MKVTELKELFDDALAHRKEHGCGGYPYEQADMLGFLLTSSKSREVLELGTGLGYSAAFMANVDKDIHIDTIDQDTEHGELAKKAWTKLGFKKQITLHLGKAEAILPELKKQYDLIFFDGYSPSMKFLVEFERLLKKGGMLVTANMFLKDELGGKYMRALQQEHRYKLGVFEDTTIALKLF